MIIENSEVLQWLELTAVALVQSLVGKLGSHKLRGDAKKNKRSLIWSLSALAVCVCCEQFY